MYRPFSNLKNVEKMIRVIDVLWEEVTLEVMLLPWKHRPYKNLPGWWKYVSSPSSKNKREAFLYWDARIENIIVRKIIKDLLADKSYYPRLVSFFKNSYADCKRMTDDLYRKSEKYYRDLSNEELVTIFKNHLKIVEFTVYAYYIPFDLVLACSQIVKNDFKKVLSGKSDSDKDKIFEILTTCQIDTITKKEKIKFLKRLIKIQKLYRKYRNLKNKEIQKIIFIQWYEFGARIFTHASNHSYELEDYQNKFRKNLKINISKKLKKIKAEESREKKILKKTLLMFKGNKEVLKHIKWLRRALCDRNFESEKINIYYEHGNKFYNEIDRRLKVLPDGHLFLSKEEILGGLAGKIDARKIHKERKKKGFTIKQKGNGIIVFTGTKKEDFHENAVAKNPKIIKGMPTYQGRVQGKVRIILDPSAEGKKFKEGMVLVASMTTPDFVALIKRAKAIVTDEGGLLCHAAIVSREFKKPCIIGTKIATQVLKDGDLVEVDANKGLVKILK